MMMKHFGSVDLLSPEFRFVCGFHFNFPGLCAERKTELLPFNEEALARKPQTKMRSDSALVALKKTH